jgi:hypothetical protein
MSQRLSTLEERQRKMRTNMGFEPASPSPTLLFLLQLLKTHGRGTAPAKEMMTMTTLKKTNSSEDTAFPSLFLVLDAKWGEDLSSYFRIPWVVI